MKLANKKIVEFIRDNWVIPMNNNSQFANDHNIDEKTVRRIREDETYQISLITIQKICEAKELKLYEFFKKVNV
jgi:DNA-binding Xre family transcriptional regulator